MSTWKQAVARAFDGAEEYDRSARIQRVAAERLATVIAETPLASRPRTLEIGCGTGLLTTALRERVGLGPMLVTDIAPAMLARCRARLVTAPDLHFAAMDGERPCLASGPEAGFDLIASNLAAQWFEDLPAALARLAALLRPGGLLAVATLAEGTFREWEEARYGNGAHHAASVHVGSSAYVSAGALRRLRFDGCVGEVRLDHLREAHPDGVSFLKALRAIGAQTPRRSDGPIPAGALRRALRSFEAQGSTITYTVATLLIRKEADRTA